MDTGYKKGHKLQIGTELANNINFLRDDVQKKNGKISDIVRNSNYPLPPCPNNDE